MDQQLIAKMRDHELMTAIGQEIAAELLQVLANKGIKEMRHEGMAIIQENGDYRIECRCEPSVAEAFGLATPFEVVVLVMASRWDVEMERALEGVLGKYRITTPDDLLNIRDEVRRKLAVFRHAVRTIADNGGEPTPLHAVAPAIAPKEGELLDAEDDDDEPTYTDEQRRAMAKEVAYKMIDEMPVGSTITEIVLIPDSGKTEGQIIFNTVRLNNLAPGQRIDLGDDTFERIVFILNTGDAFVLHNASEGDYGCDCSIKLIDIEGDLFDLIDRPLVVSEEASHHPEEGCCKSETWTYYRFATPKGFVSLRWHGSSNSYYSETVSAGLVGPLDIREALSCDNHRIDDLIEHYEEVRKLPPAERPQAPSDDSPEPTPSGSVGVRVRIHDN